MKRLLAILITLSMLLGCGCAAAETAATHQIELKTFPTYSDANQDWKVDFPLYFVDGVDDLPFVDLSDWTDVMNEFFARDGYHLTFEAKEAENVALLVRENPANTMEVDFNNGTISFVDYVAFIQNAEKLYLNPLAIPETDPNDQPFLLQIKDSRNLYGDYTVLDLKQYGIPMIAQDGKYLLPMQTVSAFLLAYQRYGMYFNGETVFFTDIFGMDDPRNVIVAKLQANGLVTPELIEKAGAIEGTQAQKMDMLIEEVGKASDEGAQLLAQINEELKNNIYVMYSSVPKKAARSQALTEYGYRELCLELDCFYGLKESHNIDSFDTFFRQNDMYMNLMDPDPSKADKAIADLVGYWLDDGHSGFVSASAMTEVTPDPAYGIDTNVRSRNNTTIATARASHPEAALPYYEVGDTAYICFDSYACSIIDYYSLPELPNDTIGIIVEAHKQITREDSPIKNVVLDMSNNGGGALDAALFTLGWFLGDASYSYRNTFTGAQTTVVVRADVNLDHQFDENDTLAGRGLKLYCLTSPVSFSCGNLVPCVFKENGGVTLLGRGTGGGSCVIGGNTTAWGTSYKYSSCRRISFLKNGAYYDVDQGVEPDFVINDYNHFYDREALTEYIHNLF